MKILGISKHQEGEDQLIKVEDGCTIESNKIDVRVQREELSATENVSCMSTWCQICKLIVVLVLMVIILCVVAASVCYPLSMYDPNLADEKNYNYKTLTCSQLVKIYQEQTKNSTCKEHDDVGYNIIYDHN